MIQKKKDRPDKKPVCANLSMVTYKKVMKLALEHSTFKSKIAEIIIEEYFKNN